MIKKNLMKKALILVLALVFISSGVMAQDIEFSILHTNDTHGRVEEGDYAGMGFAKVSTLVNDYREDGEVLLLDAGDTFHGQNIVNLSEGESIVKILNHMGYDALTVGNHDFNFGQDRLKELNEMTDFPILGANLEPQLVDDYVIKEIDGFRVGIFGLATPETAYKAHPKLMEGLEFIDPVETSKKMVEELQGKTDMIIALSHLGMSEGSDYTSIDVAEEVEGIDLIVDGHSHHALEEGRMVNDVLIVQAGEYDKNVGIVEVSVSDNEITEMTASLFTKEESQDLEKDEEVVQLVEEIKAENEEITSKVIGRTAVELNGERQYVRTGETNLGSLLGDAMLDAVDADVAITNGGGIRASIDKGEITRGEIVTVLPFGNIVEVKEIKGSTLLEAVEHGLSKYPAHEGLFPQIAGMSFVFAKDRPAGERVLEIEVNGKPIDHDKMYKVATNDFMAAGGDGYTMLKDAETTLLAGGLEEVLMQYISDKGTVSPKKEGRIIGIEVKNDNYVYEVKKGDMLREIASYFDVSLSSLIQANNIENPDMIYVGQEIVVPVK
uniref:5'-nucleotidase domain-containing protein n=1 Tax=uncultured organism TaxID=155900 RepID=M1QBR7_9ZZZZ|nr:5'-nucleotidase domain-containing protein [uncultured organism]